MSNTESRGKLRPRVAITIGDINGIGPEVLLKCLADRRILKFFQPVLVGPRATLESQAARLDLQLEFADWPDRPPQTDVDQAILVSDPMSGQNPTVKVGQITETAGRVAMASVGHATDLCLRNDVDAMVTAPISKEAIAKAGFNVPGHTEFIAARSNTQRFTMMMVADRLRVGVVTAHVPVSAVPDTVTTDAIDEKIEIISDSLHTDFGVAKPRIAVLGLNPHAGDGGVIGTEERDVIIPAINRARSAGRMAYGPFPADGFFATRRYRSFDAVLAMYHDQGLVPFKVISFNSGINYTAGLPIVRTSPDHGTAFDIAGENRASPDSMRHAIYTAIDIARRRTAAGQPGQGRRPGPSPADQAA